MKKAVTNKYYHTILYLLERCRTMREMKQLHAFMITASLITDIIPLSRLLDFCANSESGDLQYADSVFLRIDRPSVYIWNSMIKGHAGSNFPDVTLTMYREMQQLGYYPDHFTFPFVLKACAAIRHHTYGRCVHDRIVKTGLELDLYASTCLINMYMSCADMGCGEQVFEKIPKWNVVAWTTLIAGYINCNQANEAIRAFREMELHGVEPNEITMVNVLVACAQSRDIETGRWVHNRIRQMGFDPIHSNSNLILATAILDMYAKCGSLKVARDFWQKMPERNVVAWNSILSAYGQYGRANEALRLFADMRISGYDPDEATVLSVLSACACLGARILGQGVHSYVVKTNLGKSVGAGTSLMDMYAKTGDTGSAIQIFRGLKKKDVMAWTSMIIGLAINGQGKEALCIFKEMQRDEEVAPDHITYIGVLCACSHTGLVDEGLQHFSSMSTVYGISPTLEHYGCMVDLLSRAGHLEEAERLIERIPVEPNTAIWSALLNGCKIYNNFDIGNRVGNHITELKPQGGGIYVLLSNIYAKVGRWQEVSITREITRHKGKRKTDGCSLIEVKI